MDTKGLQKAIDDYIDKNPGGQMARPNPLLSALMGHDKWYVKLVKPFAPRWICTFTERRPFFPGSVQRELLEHGYMCHHPLGFLYAWARRFATRKQRWRKDYSITGNKITIPLRGSDPT